MVKETFNAKETFEAGYEMGKKAIPGQIYCLNGDLGVGKTVFTQGFAKGLGIEEPVNSPTFTIIQEIIPDNAIEIVIEKDLEKGFDYRKITIGQEAV